MLALLLALGCPAPEPPPPNLLLLTLDTTRADALSCYGTAHAHTPGLDRLAEEGARFTRAYTVTPLTIPAHSSLFTGLYPPRHGVRDNGDAFLEEGAVTLAERLQGAGYATAAAVGAEVTSRHWGFSQGFEAYYDDMGDRGDADNRWRVERPGDAVVGDALTWLAERDPADARPWFLWVHLFDPHHPYAAPEEWRARHPRRPYQAEVAWTDHLVEVLVGALEERGDLERTWVVAVGDHGEGLGSHGEGMHGTLLYDATTRVPLLVRPPGGTAARTVDFPVSLVDLGPTLLGAAGQPVPAGADGVDLGPWLRPGAPPPSPDRAVYVESQYAWRHYGWAPQTALVDGTHKLISSTTPELYARGDRGERRDLGGTDPERLEAMGARLEALVAEMSPEEATAGPAAGSAERIAMLEMLGYVTTTAAPDTAVGLPDPVDQLPLLRGLDAARGAVQSGDLEGAREQLVRVLERDPNLVEARTLLARVHSMTGDVPGAIALAESVYEEHPTASHGATLGHMYLAAGRADDAVLVLGRAVEEDPTLALARVGWLQALQSAGDPRLYAEAEAALATLPEEPGVLAMAGLVRVLSGEPEAGEAYLLAARDRDPWFPGVHHGLGLVYTQRGESGQAEEALLEEVRLHPPAIASRRLLVSTYAEQRRYEEQAAQLRPILAHDPTPLDRHALAQALFNLGRYDEAAPHVEACRTMAPEDPGCAMLHANVLKKLGRDAEALAVYEEALRLAESRPPVSGPFKTGPP